MCNKKFKKESDAYKILAIADMNNGVSTDFFKQEIKNQEIKEKYEICNGLNEALKFIFQSKEGNK